MLCVNFYSQQSMNWSSTSLFEFLYSFLLQVFSQDLCCFLLHVATIISHSKCKLGSPFQLPGLWTGFNFLQNWKWWFYLILQTFSVNIPFHSSLVRLPHMNSSLIVKCNTVKVFVFVSDLCKIWPGVGSGYPLSAFSPPLSIHFFIFCFFYFSPFPFLFFVHPFPFYQDRPTPFPGRRSQEATKPGFSLFGSFCVLSVLLS